MTMCNRSVVCMCVYCIFNIYYLSSLIKLICCNFDLDNILDTCSSLMEFNEVTLCLNKFSKILTNEVMDKYKKHVEHLLETQLKETDYKIILNAVLLLNMSQWRHKNVFLTSKCLLLLKNHLDLFTISELATVYGVKYVLLL